MSWFVPAPWAPKRVSGVTVALVKPPTAKWPKPRIRVGADVLAQIGVKLGDVYELAWGREENAGQVLLRPPTTSGGVAARNTGRVGKSRALIWMFGIPPQEPIEFPDGSRRRVKLAKVEPEDAEHEVLPNQRAIVITLPASWWADERQVKAAKAKEPVPEHLDPAKTFHIDADPLARPEVSRAAGSVVGGAVGSLIPSGMAKAPLPHGDGFKRCACGAPKHPGDPSCRSCRELGAQRLAPVRPRDGAAA